MASTYPPLTPSGKGATITDRRITEFAPDEIRALLAQHQWLVFKRDPVRPVAIDDLITYLGQFGKLTDNDRRKDHVLKIDASKTDEGEVLLGQGFLPLHRDGALMGNKIEIVGIFCVQYQDVTGGGRTFITDIENGCKDVPAEILETIRAKGIEGRPVDRYYTAAADAWHWIPGFAETEGQSYLNVGFPYRPGEKPSWMLRIPGVDDDRCAEMFETMRTILMSDQYCYYHQWAEGDLLLLDNRKTLHGREAFQGRRALANLQVLAG
jgi:(5R)-carbapenem-3-carboxylate synthase